MQKVYSIKERLMRYLFACIFMMLALPAAAAQPSAACKGQQSYALSDGSTWCLLHSDKTTLTSTLSRDDGNSKSSSNQAHIFVVVMNGAFSKRMGTSEKRMKEICQVMRSKSPDLFAGRTQDRNIIVSMLLARESGCRRNSEAGSSLPQSSGGDDEKMQRAAPFRDPFALMTAVATYHGRHVPQRSARPLAMYASGWARA